MKLVIKGAYYKSGNEILIPLYTGEYVSVNCVKYCTLQDLEDIYDDDFISENKDNKVKVDGITYYYADVFLQNVSNEWELLSDLSSIAYNEKKFRF